MIKNNLVKLYGKILAIFLVGIAAVLGVVVIWHMETAPRTDDAYAYADTISVAPQVSGRIMLLAVKDNQKVRKGAVLFRLDSRQFIAAMHEAEASLTTLNNEIDLMQRNVNAQKFGALAADASVNRARTAYEQAESTLRRMEPLLDKQYVSAEQLDQARTARNSAQSALDTAMLQARSATAGITGVNALIAKRDVLKAQIELARLNVEYSVVRAPFDGIVINLKTSSGQFVPAGQPVFTFVNATKWYVIANFRETELRNIRPGESAQVYMLSNSSKKFAGHVESIGYGVFPDDGGGAVAGLPNVPKMINWVRVAQRFPVKIAINDPDASIFRIGASAVAILRP